MRVWYLPATLITLTLLQASTAGKKFRIRGIKWWNLANTKHFNSDDALLHSLNPSLQPLARRQRKLVARNPGSIVAIAAGAQMAIDECQFQFRNRRWNCPTSDYSHGGSIFGKILRKGCRETAFIYALTSAALVHTIARACSEGSIYTCTCGRRTRRRTAGDRDWEWGGCSDNADFGHRFSRNFIDTVEKGRDLRYTMNLHNNEAGRLHVGTKKKQECKCHGMSGSCTLKTCWMRLPSFRTVGTALKDRFDGASKVLQGNSVNRGDRRKRSRRFNLIPVDSNHKPPSLRDLVYYENSPNYCERDNSIGFKGTRGRECNATSIGVDGCDLMCCDRGYRSVTYTARERCNCVFHWCCKVTCDTCTKTKVRYTCL